MVDGAVNADKTIPSLIAELVCLFHVTLATADTTTAPRTYVY